eukprot:NODE_3338_length_799_cov_330.752688.p1 GENE.NODE_3338_length_799_cov_330.752688~~NODE_3338_length_799_cov_330.752688.p1  ORF type:complete len:218 (+),score=61.34 NODE_3338_length_799_cov_330.752688:74-727(+)
MRGDARLAACLLVICHLAAHSAYQRLRTEEQLGYATSACAWELHGIGGLRVSVQGPRLAPDEVDRRIEAWLMSMHERLETMPDDVFKRHAAEAACQRARRGRHLHQETARLWSEICARTHCFDRPAREAEALRSLQRADAAHVFSERLAAGAPKRRKLSVRVLSGAAATSRFCLGAGASEVRALRPEVLHSLQEVRALQLQLATFPPEGGESSRVPE